MTSSSPSPRQGAAAARPRITSIELLLDEETDAGVRADWTALAAAGVSSLAAHTAPSNRPHLTLLARASAVPMAFADASALLPIPIVLGPPLLFGAGPRRVLARSVVPSAALLELHALVHTTAGPVERRHGAGPGEVDHTLPGRWTPHVTLARRLRTTDLAAALELLGGDLVGRAVALRRWDAATATVTEL